jgi:hypothetical protein
MRLDGGEPTASREAGRGLPVERLNRSVALASSVVLRVDNAVAGPPDVTRSARSMPHAPLLSGGHRASARPQARRTGTARHYTGMPPGG